MALVVYNTMSKKKEEFVPTEPGHVKMYVCGPTVYDFLHIGNFRGAIFFNLVANWLEKRGYDVNYVYNYTDVDDKIINRANEEGKTAKEISETYIAEFEKDYGALQLRAHNHRPRVSEYIPQIVKIVEKLIENKKAYVVEGEVLYSVKSFAEYGKLSHKNIDELLVGARVEIDSKKENPLDFALWKPAKPGEPEWQSPWSSGRPGWHIECSAMAHTLLGEQIDIHGGGIDLIFPHHENEIAQTEGATGKNFVKYWMHNNFINFGAHKMSKSLGNITTGRAFLTHYNPEILKYLILSAHYRSPSDFSESPINNTIQALSRIYSALCAAKGIASAQVAPGKLLPKFEEALKKAQAQVEEALDDDFNTPEVFAAIFDLVRMFNSLYRKGQKVTPEIAALGSGLTNFIVGTGKLMSLFQEEPKAFLISLDDRVLDQKGIKRSDIDAIVAQRTQARANKDFAASDRLRDELLAKGIEIQDTPIGTEWEVKK
jgi:cysteinyl-tRNA synthetase